MVGGLICSDDVIYFLAVISLFLWLSVIKLNNEKTRRSFLSKTMRYTLAVCTIIVIGFASSRPALMFFMMPPAASSVHFRKKVRK